jgi:hypothetical protein
VRHTVPKDGWASGYRTHSRPFRVFWAAAPAQTETGGSDLDICSVSGAVSVAARVVGSGLIRAVSGVAIRSRGTASRLPASDDRSLALWSPGANRESPGFHRQSAGLSGTRGFRRWAVPSVSPSPGVNRGRGPSSPGATASLPSRRKRLAFRRLSPSVRVGASPDEAPKRLACAGWPAVRRAFAFLANRAAPLSPGRPKPPRGGRPNPTGFLSDPGGAGDSPRFSGRTPGPNWVPVRHCLSALPSGSASSGYPAIIDSRSGLIRQPNVSVRVASR